MSIGFVVIGRNEGERLTACLDALRGNGAPVVYADSASSDDSVARSRRAGATVVSLDSARPMNASRGRREGFDRLISDHPATQFVQFLDGDCILQPGWIEQATAFLQQNPQVAVTCGLRFERDPQASIYNRLCNEEWQTPIGAADACGGDALMRVAAYRQAGGFRSDLMAGEEPELCTRLRSSGWRIWRLDAPMTEHDAKILRLSQWLRRGMRSGYGYAQVWTATKEPDRLYGRQMLSAVLWGVMAPLALIVIALITRSPGFLLLIPIAFLVQTARIAIRRNVADAFSWRRGALLMFSKPAEAIGVLRFVAGRGRNEAIEYKNV